jgi:Tn7-like transposition protein D/TniQ
MLLHLPKPYEDELLYSIFARFWAHSKPKNQWNVNLAILGKRSAFSTGFGARLDDLAKYTNAIWNASSDDLIDNMTLLPFYGYYLPFKRYSKCLACLKSGDPRSLYVYLGVVTAKAVSTPTHLRFCLSCALADQAGHGEMYWRRSHQLPGAIICTTHNEVLKLSRAEMFPQNTRYFQDATSYIDIETSPDCAELEAKEFEFATKISARCSELLHASATPWTTFYPSHLYREAAKMFQSRQDRPQMVDGDIARDLIEFFGDEFLFKLGCKFSSSSGLLKKFFRPSNSQSYHPLIHVLAQVFLESRVGNPPQLHQIAHSLLEKQWKCPNPYVKHSGSFRIPTVTPRLKRDKSRYWSAKCTCGYGFSFAKSVKDDQLMPAVEREFSYGPAFETHAKKLQSDGASVNRIGKAMGVTHAVAARLVNGARSNFEVSQEEIESLRDRWTRERCPKAYRKLFRHDKIWLKKKKHKSPALTR